MKSTHSNNISVSGIIENQLGILFNNHEFSLNGWGEVDNYCRLDNNNFIFLECEKGQKHPNTNLLKLWPYLEENPNIKIVLFHYFFPENNAPKNRLALCKFLANKLETEFHDRFQYFKIEGGADSISQSLKVKRTGLIQIILPRK